MPKVDFTFDFGREREEPLYLDFVASRPPAGTASQHRTGPSGAEDRPLHLDLANREPQRGGPGAIYHGFAGDPAGAGPALAQRRLLGPGLVALGLTAIVGLAVAGALWIYPALERRTLEDEAAPAAAAPSAPPRDPAAEIAALKPLEEAPVAKLPAQLETAPSPPPRQERVSELRPEAPAHNPQTLRKMRRPQTTSAGPEASAATARANALAAYAPESTLSAQSAAQAQPAGD